MFEYIYNFLADICLQFGIPLFILNALVVLSWAAVLAFLLILVVMFLVWMERKVSAHMQSRFGPMRVGRHGWLQLIADTIKLLGKEDITPRPADKPIFFLAPIVAFAAAFLAYLVIPFDKHLIVADLNIGMLYILAVTSITVVGILMGGWGSGSKWTVLGAMRSASQIIAYEVPLLLSVLSVIMLAGSLSMNSIVEAQNKIWFIFFQPLAFLIYLAAAVAESNRAPFDIPEAEQELVSGYNTEYSGIKFAMFFFAEYVNLFTVSAIAATLFLGGWTGQVLPGFVWFLLKTFFVVFLIMWFKWTFPRVRVDQLSDFGWKVLTPLAFINIGVTGLVLLLV